MSIESVAAKSLAATGPFAELIDGFSPRVEQQEMAALIEEVIDNRDVLVCEAGTGTGKTFAYLVPALQSGLKTIISTATKTLQDQLYYQDLPIVREALGVSIESGLLKGRQNYLCLLRLERAQENLGLNTQHHVLLDRLTRWSSSTVSGDLEEVHEFEEDMELRYAVTSTTDNCLGQECPFFESCFVVRARRIAAGADIVIVNHHLLFADMVLRETGFAELLPSAEVIILDEAHKIPDIASVFFSRSVSGQQISNLCRDVLSAIPVEAPDTPALKEAVTALEMAREAFRRECGDEPRRSEWDTLQDSSNFVDHLRSLGLTLVALNDCLDLSSERGPSLSNCHERAQNLSNHFQVFEYETEREHVRWLESTPRGFVLHDTPISVAGEFSQRVQETGASWILTSATLAVEGHFEHFTDTLGIKNARECLWQSPFNYRSQSLFYVPSLECEPRSPEFEHELVQAVLPILESSRGRAFFLFTSYRALHICADLLRDLTPFPLLVQGESPRSTLLSDFKSLDNAVLLGTATFWEGVDVRGEQLSCVIIDKLPFGVPNDPVTKARMAAISEEGGNPFTQLQLPAAITALNQGAGRLIRDVTDRGVLVLGDVRILRRSYGRSFINSLPPMPLTCELADVEAFFSSVRNNPA